MLDNHEELTTLDATVTSNGISRSLSQGGRKIVVRRLDKPVRARGVLAE